MWTKTTVSNGDISEYLPQKAYSFSHYYYNDSQNPTVGAISSWTGVTAIRRYSFPTPIIQCINFVPWPLLSTMWLRLGQRSTLRHFMSLFVPTPPVTKTII